MTKDAVKEIVRRFGTQAQLAEALGVRQSAVAQWIVDGEIPPGRHKQLLDLAAERGVLLQYSEFFEERVAPAADQPEAAA